MLKAVKSTIKWIAAIVVICAALYFLASVNGLSVSRNIGEVEGLQATEAEYKYYLEVAKSEMLTENGITDDEAAKEFWKSEIDGKKAADIVKENAKQELIRTLAACAKAQEAGIVLTEEEKASATSFLSATDAQTKEQVAAVKKATGADEQQLTEILERQLLSNAYASKVAEEENSPLAIADEEVKTAAAEQYACVKHVLVLNTPSSEPVVTEDGQEVPSATFTDEEVAKYKEEAKKKADDVLAKALAGENFETLIKEYGEDPGMESMPDGYVIDETGMLADGSSTMVPEFTKGSFAMAAGEVNPQLVESSYGWHIIKRYPVNVEGEDFANALATVKSNIFADKFGVYVDGLLKDMNISFNDKIMNSIKVK